MSYLQKTLADLMNRHSLKGVDVARTTGINNATISHWLNGTQISIRDGDLEKIASAVATTPQEQAELVRARMLDVCTGPGSELIKIQIGERALREPSARYNVDPPLPDKFEHAFRVLRRNINDPDVRELVLGLAGLLDRPEENLDSRKKLRVKPHQTSDNPALDEKATPPTKYPKPTRRRLAKGERGVEPIEEN